MSDGGEQSTPTSDATETRQTFMHAYAQATEAELAIAVAQFGEAANASDVRSPETGLVMLRGRMGGDGAPFNVGEATVTRAVVRLQSGETGYAYLLGRSTERARMAATLDALSQTSAAARATIMETLVAPVSRRVALEQQKHAAETAATRVDFFTLARGDD